MKKISLFNKFFNNVHCTFTYIFLQLMNESIILKFVYTAQGLLYCTLYRALSCDQLSDFLSEDGYIFSRVSESQIGGGSSHPLLSGFELAQHVRKIFQYYDDLLASYFLGRYFIRTLYNFFKHNSYKNRRNKIQYF